MPDTTRQPLGEGAPLARAFARPAMLGLFLPTFHGGWSASTLPRETDWQYDYISALAQRADVSDFDLAFGYSLWLPKGGEGPTRSDLGLESLTSAIALLAETRNLLIAGTVHPFYGPWHPLHIAKFGATLDHIGKGRWGFNFVTGHRAYEHELFGKLQIPHDERYQLADEFTTALERLWLGEAPLSAASRIGWSFNDAYISPKPVHGRPFIMTATGSAAGIEFATSHADIVFIASPGGSTMKQALASLPEHTGRIKAAAAAKGRSIRLLINPLLVLRETDAAAEDYANAIVAHADLETLKGGRAFASDAHAWRAYEPGRGEVIGGNLQIIGSPETVAHNLAQLKAAGVDGFQVSFYDYGRDFDLFVEQVIPRLRQRGLR